MVTALLVLSACGSATAHPQATPKVTKTTTAGPTTTTVVDPGAGEYLVASPLTSPLQYAATPGGPPIGTLETVTWGAPTVRPVVTQSDGYVQIQLDTRPNGSTGWVPRTSVNLAITAYRIVISTSQRSLTLYQNGQAVYSSPVGVGLPASPTPMGQTFVDAVVATPTNQLSIYGPTVIVLGTHSNVYTDFDGGDGTVAIHGYPSNPASTEGVASSHGCVRAPPAAIDAIDKVPLGSPVDVVA